MNRGAWLFVLAVGCAAALPAPPRAVAPWRPVSAPVHREPTFDELLLRVRTLRGAGKGPYVMPSAQEQRDARLFVTAMLRGEAAMPAMASEGLSPSLRALVAAPGHGLMLLRDAPVRQLVIEVPHSFADLHTLEIGLGLFHALGARALLVNGTQRFVGCAKPEVVEGDSIDKTLCPADVAHAAHSLFMGMHEALAEESGTLFIQVHGFQPTEGDPLVILSAAGTVAPLEPLASALGARLAVLSPRPVATYPAEIGRLGGLTNVQARSLAAQGGAMLHVELSRTLRERLRSDEALRTAFSGAFEAARAP